MSSNATLSAPENTANYSNTLTKLTQILQKAIKITYDDMKNRGKRPRKQRLPFEHIAPTSLHVARKIVAEADIRYSIVPMI